MQQTSPYRVPENEELPQRKATPLKWSSMLRFSVHFTLLGVILSCLGLKFILSSGVGADGDPNAQVDDMFRYFDGFVSTTLFVSAFILLGLVFILLSLLMRKNEKKQRQST